MDHDEVRDTLEVAAAEPSGLERLMAGDTATAQAVAGHLAGCPSCAAELARLERVSSVVRDVVVTTPPEGMGERILATVQSLGRDRTVASTPEGAVVPFPASSTPAPAASTGSGRGSILPWVAAIAAAVVLSVVATTFIVGNRTDQQLAAQQAQITALRKVTDTTLRVAADPEAGRVILASTDGSDAAGTLVFSPETTELVVTATGLTGPPAGKEYRCWLQVDGQRQKVGKMFFADDLAFWVGPAPVVDDVGSGAWFGVSLVDAAGTSLDGPPVIAGEL